MSKKSSVQNEKLYSKAKELAIKGLNETASPFKRRPSIFYKLDHIMLYGGTIINIIIYLINYFALNLRLEINSSDRKSVV